MPDTVRTRLELETLLHDNTSQDISAQDIRDFLKSVYIATEVDTLLTFSTLAITGTSGVTTLTSSKPSNESNGSNANYNTQILSTYNQTSTVATGGTDWYVKRTETSVGSGEHNLIKAEVNDGSITNTKLRLTNKGNIIRSGGYFTANGDSRATSYILMRQTTTSGDSELTIGGGSPGSTNRLSIPTGSVFAVTAKIFGRKVSNADCCVYTREFLVSNTSGTASLQGSVQTVGTDIQPFAIGGITVATTGNSIQLLVAGATTTTINWTSKTEMIEL